MWIPAPPAPRLQFNGLGLALVIPCVSSLIADYYPPDARGRAFGFMGLTASFGGRRLLFYNFLLFKFCWGAGPLGSWASPPALVGAAFFFGPFFRLPLFSDKKTHKQMRERKVF